MAEYRVGPGHWQFGAQLPAPVHGNPVQLAVQPPNGSVPVIADRPSTATFDVYNLTDQDVTARPAVSVGSGFSATAPDSVTLPAHDTVPVRVEVRRTATTATDSTLRLDLSGNSASVPVEGTDDLARVATMSASSTHSGWDPARTNDGQTAAQTDYSLWNSGEGWNDGTSKAWPDTLTATWSQPETVGHVRVLTLDTSNQPAANYGLRDYDVQALVDGTWTTVGSVRGNTAATIDTSFAPVDASALRLVITDSNDHTYSRVVEFEAFAG
jgi:alpha-L-rhamnosidase